MSKEIKFHISDRDRVPSLAKLLEKIMPKKHSELFSTETKVIPGVFRCSSDGSVLRVEVVGTRFGRVEILIGAPEIAKPIFVNRSSAAVLRDFFADLAQYI